jgi:hypothetical protein
MHPTATYPPAERNEKLETQSDPRTNWMRSAEGSPVEEADDALAIREDGGETGVGRGILVGPAS